MAKATARARGKSRIVEKHGAAVDQVSDLIRQRIISGRYVPGQRLVLRDLIEENGFSPGTFREAFRLLTAEKLLKLVPNRGVAVQQLTREEIVELFQIRELLEGLAARLAAERIDEGNNRRIFLEVCHRIKKGTLPEREAYIQYNELFHKTILKLSGNSRLPELLDQIQIPLLMSRWRQSMTKSDIEGSLQEHDEIIKGILSGNPGQAKLAMDRHQQKGARRTLAFIDGQS